MPSLQPLRVMVFSVFALSSALGQSGAKPKAPPRLE